MDEHDTWERLRQARIKRSAIQTSEPEKLVSAPLETSATDVAANAAAEASIAIRSARVLVGKLKFTGIVGGSSPRALIDGRAYRVGDVVDVELGVKIARIDPAKRFVEFTDSSGTSMIRTLE